MRQRNQQGLWAQKVIIFRKPGQGRGPSLIQKVLMPFRSMGGWLFGRWNLIEQKREKAETLPKNRPYNGSKTAWTQTLKIRWKRGLVFRLIEQMGGERWGRVGVLSAFGVFCSFFHLGRPVLGLGVRLALPVEEETEWGERATVCGYDTVSIKIL